MTSSYGDESNKIATLRQFEKEFKKRDSNPTTKTFSEKCEGETWLRQSWSISKSRYHEKDRRWTKRCSNTDSRLCLHPIQGASNVSGAVMGLWLSILSGWCLVSTLSLTFIVFLSDTLAATEVSWKISFPTFVRRSPLHSNVRTGFRE